MATQRPSFVYQGLISLLALLMVMLVLGSLSQFWKINVPSLHLMQYAGASVAFSWLCWRFPRGGLFLVIGAGVGFGALLPKYPAWTAHLSKVTREWYDFWAHMRALQFDITFGENLAEVFLIAIALGVALLIVTESLSEGSTFWSLATGTSIFGLQWAWFFDKSANAFMFYAAAATVVWVLAQAARRDARWAGSGRRVGYRSHVTTPIAWVLSMALVAAVLPTEFAPIHLGRFGEKLQEAFPILKQMRGVGGVGGRFSLRSTGFAPIVGTLGGPVQVNNEPALDLITERPLSKPVYLRGIAFTNYTGETWLSGDPLYLQIPQDGILPTGYSPDVFREYSSVRITPLVSFGSTIFNQLEPMLVEDLKSPYRVDGDGNMWSERMVPKGSTYEVGSRIPLYSAEHIRLLSTSVPGDNMKPYLQVPDQLPQRVSETARSVTQGQTHPYDKAVALEGHLRRIPYDLNAPRPPRGRDFVDFFLFDAQRGYCTYYASAMAVMLRTLGIPTRFVEGFAVPAAADFSEKPDEYTYVVRNSRAHAWVEVYFPGYGWVTFDPTPRADLPPIDRSLPPPAASDPSNDFEDLGDEGSDWEDEFLSEDPGLAGSTGGGGANDGGAGGWSWTLAVLVGLAGAAYLVYRRLRSQHPSAASERRQELQEVWDKTSALFDLFDFGRGPSQTAQEYALSLGKTWPTLSEPLAEVAADYTMARFSPPDRPIDSEAAGRARRLWENAHEVLLSRFGWRTYLLRRLQLARKRRGEPGP